MYIRHYCSDFLSSASSEEKQIVQSFDQSLEGRPVEDVKQLLGKNSLLANTLYKRDLNRKKLKLIIQELVVEDVKVFCFRKLLDHGLDYDRLRLDPRTWLDQHPITMDEMQKIEEKVHYEIEKTRKKREPVPEAFRGWLKSFSLIFEATIYESEKWVSGLSNDFKHYWQTFRDILTSIVDQQDEYLIEKDFLLDRPMARLFGKEDCYVLCEAISISDKDKSATVYFLYDYFLGGKPLTEDIVKIVQGYNDFNSKDDMVPYARRAYPDWALSDDNVWCGIEGIFNIVNADQFDSANLALSGEEELFLQHARLPLFINGQAGSGKTTMLWYLFAYFISCKKGDTCNHYDGDPLFLTYSQSLLEEAKKGVAAILQFNINYDLADDERKDIADFIDRNLYSFQHFVKDKYVIPHCNEGMFLEENHVGFLTFKQLYMNLDVKEEMRRFVCRLKEKEDLSAELVWHVIRTYIKGYSELSELNPTDYRQNIPEKDRSVDVDTYEKIFNTIYLKWYKKFFEEKHLWDDMDLIRFALNQIKKNQNGYERYPVIFCDEAQDFTKVELEFLLRISIFTQYDLSHEERIPFAFAGDPLQTLNPTGFSWTRLRAEYYYKFKELNSKNIYLDLKDLEKNYRSKPPIVKFANLIQFYRKDLLSVDVKPQDWWQQDTMEPPAKFIFSDNIDLKTFQEITENNIIVIPSELDDEQNFVAKDEEDLKLLFGASYEGGDDLAKFFSPSRAKGLEFKTIVLYKFGEAAGDLISNLINNVNSSKYIEESNFISCSYFFNKLYVAATRAREHLVIIDTKQGEKNLWSYFAEDSDCNRYKEVDDESREEWEDKIGYPVMGDETTIAIINEAKDPLSIAEELAQKGRWKKDADLLRRAAVFYRRAGKAELSFTCKAEAFEFQGKWSDAGKIWWQDLNKLERAGDCFWRGREWDQLFSLQEKIDSHQHRKYVALFMLDPTLDTFHQYFVQKNVVNAAMPDDYVWKTVVAQVQKVLEQSLEDKTKSSNKTASGAEQIAQMGFDGKGLYNIIAKYYFKGGSYLKAAEYWKKIDAATPDYYWAEAHASVNHLEKINWLLKLNYGSLFDDRAVEQFILNTWDSIENKEDAVLLRNLGSHFFKGNEWKRAISFWNNLDPDFPQDYYWAQYEVSSNPVDRIKWLIKLPHSKTVRSKILEEWEEVKKEDEQLKQFKQLKIKYNVFDMLMMSGDREDEAQTLVQNGHFPRDWFEWMRHCLVVELKNKAREDEAAHVLEADSWKAWPDDWIAIIKREKAWEIFQAIAASPRSGLEIKERMEALKSIQRDPLIAFVKHHSKQVMEYEDLESLSLTQLCSLGAAIERVYPNPYLIGLLKIYEQAQRHPDISTSIQRWVRERWLVIQQKKIRVDSEANNRDDTIRRSRQEMERKKKEWDIHRQPAEYPDPLPGSVSIDDPEPERNNAQLAKGKEQGIREVAMNLLEMGKSYEEIEQATRLSQDEIRVLDQKRKS